MDGEIFMDQLKMYGRDMSWLLTHLGNQGLKPEKIFLATMEKDRGIVIHGYDIPSKI